MRINTNISSLTTQRTLNQTEGAVSKSMQKLSSGFRINRASDDAAGLGIANKLRAETRAMTQASRNAEQASSLLQITEGSVSSVQSILERMKELATQSASDNVDDNARARIDKEFSDLSSEITRTVNTTKFQGNALINGDFGAAVVEAGSTALASGTTYQEASISGANSGLYTLTNTAAGKLVLSNASKSETATLTADGKQSVSFTSFGISIETTASFDKDATAASQGGAAGGLTFSVAAGSSGGSFLVSSSGSYNDQDLITLGQIDLTLGNLGISSSDLTSASGSQTALTAIDSAIDTVASYLGDIGAAQNRIEYATANVKTAIQNFTAAESVIRDVDMAEEMSNFSKNQILQQAGTAMLAQANQLGQGVLTLLRG
jgi:flagellin